MDKITMAGDVGGDVGKFIDSQEASNPAAVSTKVHVAIDAFAEKAKPAVDRLSESAHEATDGLAQAASEALERLMEIGTNLDDVRGKLLERSRTYVVENPLKALGIGVLAGLLLTRVLGGGKEDESAPRSCLP